MVQQIFSIRGEHQTDLFGQYQPENILNFFQLQEKKLLKRRQKIEALKKDNVHIELQPPLILAQLISLMPVNGVTQADHKILNFRWRSLKVLYSFTLIVAMVILSVLTIKNYVRNGISFRSFGDVLFYVGGTIASVMFIRLAVQWTNLVEQWIVVQNTMLEMENLSIRKKIKVLTFAMVISSVVEHLLSNYETLSTFGGSKDALGIFLEKRHQQVFSVIPYSHPVGFLLYFTNFIITLVWNYTDIFLTTVSLALAKMFKQFSKDLQMTSDTLTIETSPVYWKKRREVYSQLALLVKMLDDKLSLMILFSFGINLYYICIQLLNSLRALTSIVNFIYFTGSFGHLIFRTCAVAFAASSIYETSKEPLPVIFAVPSEFYNIEVQRLQMQISTETLALTGCNFFTVTRTLMLTLAGTIVTYEIVLVQFNKIADDATEATTSIGQFTSGFTIDPFTNSTN